MDHHGYCKSSSDCVAGCVPAELADASARQRCPSGFYWRDEVSCVAVHDCACANEWVRNVAPGGVIRQGECTSCQCLNNEFICEDSSCEEEQSSIEDDDQSKRKTSGPSARPGSASYEDWEWGDYEDAAGRNTSARRPVRPSPIPPSSSSEDYDWNEYDDFAGRNASGQTRRPSSHDGRWEWNEIEYSAFRNTSGRTRRPTRPRPSGPATVPASCSGWSPWFNDNSPSSKSNSTSSNFTSFIQDLWDFFGILMGFFGIFLGYFLGFFLLGFLGQSISSVSSASYASSASSASYADAGDKEFKTAEELSAVGFCADGHISEIECRDVRRHQLASQMDDIGVVCSLNDGLHCPGEGQPKGRRCHDYHVRYYCHCLPAATDATTPVFIWTPESQIFAACQSDTIRLLGTARTWFVYFLVVHKCLFVNIFQTVF